MAEKVCFEVLSIAEIMAHGEIEARGIYFLFRGGELAYVGKTVNFTQRMSDHIRNGMECDEYRVIPCPAADLDVMEALYVRHYKPPLNRGRGGIGRKPRL